MPVILGLVILIAYDQSGKWLMRALDWPIPGSVMGMVMLFATLLVIKKPPQAVTQSAELMLRHLALFFVPAGVGIMLLLDVIRDEWLAMSVAMVVSTVISMLFTAVLMQGLIEVQQRVSDHDS